MKLLISLCFVAGLLADLSMSNKTRADYYVQPSTLRNSQSTSSSNAAQTKSIAAVAGQSVALFSVNMNCSAGTATVTVKDGVAGTTIWLSAAALSTSLTWNTPLTSTSGNGMDIVVSTCGASNTSTLNVQASQL